jgi:hypothetical protein
MRSGWVDSWLVTRIAFLAMPILDLYLVSMDIRKWICEPSMNKIVSALFLVAAVVVVYVLITIYDGTATSSSGQIAVPQKGEASSMV